MKQKYKLFQDKNSALKVRSRYVQGGTSEVAGDALKWWERDDSILVEADDDIIINKLAAVYSGRPDLLANDVYNDGGLEWIILQSNLIVDLEEEFITGVSLRIPSARRVYSEILIKTVNFIDVSTK